MNSLVLIPVRTGLRCFRVATGPSARAQGEPAFFPRGTTTKAGSLRAVLGAGPKAAAIDVLAIRATYGGLEFPAPVIVDSSSQARLLGLAAQAPLAVANTNSLLDEARASFPGIPIALAFETSFFVDLPARETTYALPEEVGRSLRRWGYHGLYHDAATSDLGRILGPRQRPARMLSVCLDARPEMAAVLGRAPLMVTGGLTEVEGLPGERNSGEIDPAIPLALAADPAIGPERADLLLTRESGFFGMLGRHVTLGEVLSARGARTARVREHLLYRMGLAAGSGLAALDGLDGIVFSGRYAEHGDKVAAHLIPRIERVLDVPAGSLPWHVCATPLETIVAEAGVSALIADGQRRRGRATNGGAFPRQAGVRPERAGVRG
ncbi:MAG: acetate/propionate family kinase [Deltaproteobacteria bacterium]|nr:acetate/propionate family kinase [Deltaproteobacteria bacterium]